MSEHGLFGAGEDPVDRLGVPRRASAIPYQEDISLVEDVDLEAATPGDDINWLEDIELLSEDGTPAVFDRYSNSFIKIHFAIPAGRENEIARKVLITHLQSGNSYGIQLKEKHCKFPQPELGPWVAGLEDRRHRLEAAGARGLGSAAALTDDHEQRARSWRN